MSSTYIEDNALFPPSAWTEIHYIARRTNNGPEAFHAHYNEQFYVTHPSMLVFLVNIIKIQVPHISSSAVQALTQSEVVIIPRKKLLCWNSIGSLEEEKWVVEIMFVY